MSLDTAKLMVAPSAPSPDEVACYAALETGAVWWESHGHWSTFHGDKAADALNGLITNDVSVLLPGEGLHAAALTARGKMIADLFVIRLDAQTFTMTVLRSAAPEWLAMARKYVNPRLCRIVDDSERYRTWMVYGARAAEAIVALGGGDATAENLSEGMVSALAEWPTWHHGPWNLGRVTVRLIRAPLMGSRPGFVLMAEAADGDLVQQRIDASQILRGTRAVWDIARVEAGRPAMGVDMDENTIPQEANLDTLGAISFTKGCYTGQETVARIHFRGHVNRHLRGLTASAPLPRGADVLDETGKVVGDVRSTVISPRFGPIALAMLRREVVIGAAVSVATEGGPIAAAVLELPFSAA